MREQRQNQEKRHNIDSQTRVFLSKLFKYIHHTLPITDREWLERKIFPINKEIAIKWTSSLKESNSKDQVIAEGNLSTEISHNKRWEEHLSILHTKISKCQSCFLAEGRSKDVVTPIKPKVSEVSELDGFVVLENIPFESQESGTYFSNRSGTISATGSLLKKIVVNGLGMDFEKTYVTSLIKCTRATNFMEQLEEASPCLSHLETELSIFNPSLILVFGGLAFSLLHSLGELTYHGKSLELPTNLTSTNPIFRNSQPSAISAEEALFEFYQGKKLEFKNRSIVFTHSLIDIISNSALKKPVWHALKPYANKKLKSS